MLFPRISAIRNLRSAIRNSAFLLAAVSLYGADLEPLRFNNPGLTVDLAVGLWAWPVPVDLKGDGHFDLIVVCPDTPYNGVYLFENTAGDTAKNPMPVFKAARRIGKGGFDVTPSYVGGKMRVMTPAAEYPDFAKTGLEKPVRIDLPVNPHSNKVRSNQWRYVDYDGDGVLDLAIGVDDWKEYGWDRAFNERGEWTHGPLHGFLYLLHNRGTNEKPIYDSPVKLEADGKPIDTYGCPSPCFADFRGTGALDLICGEFMDGFTFYENIGDRTHPKYAAGRRLRSNGKPLTMDLEMLVVTPFDWNKDGRVDLIVGQEDGRVAFIENLGKTVDGVPEFAPPRYFQQEADLVKFGALATPVGVDWDGDGKEDILAGDSAGYIGFFKNLGGNPPKWAAPQYLEADGQPIRIMAGKNGSVQGPAEAKWGYTTFSVADWDGDGLPDIVANSILGKIVWWRNIGTKTQPKLAAAQPIEVEWPGAPPKPAWDWWQPKPRELVTQWRTTPVAIDWNGSGLKDLIMLDPEGWLNLFERKREGGVLKLMPGKRVFFGQGGCEFDASGKKLNSADGLLRLNSKAGGGSGRRKFCIADWDGDGKPDLLVNGTNVDFLRNVSTTPGEFVFRDLGPVATRRLAGHDTSPTTVNWRGDGIPDLLVGAEDGHLYFLSNPRHSSP